MHLLILFTVKEDSIRIMFWWLNWYEFREKGTLTIELKLGESFKRFLTEKIKKLWLISKIKHCFLPFILASPLNFSFTRDLLYPVVCIHSLSPLTCIILYLFLFLYTFFLMTFRVSFYLSIWSFLLNFFCRFIFLYVSLE